LQFWLAHKHVNASTARCEEAIDGGLCVKCPLTIQKKCYTQWALWQQTCAFKRKGDRILTLAALHTAAKLFM